MPSVQDLEYKSIFSEADVRLAALDNVFHTMLQDEVDRARAEHAPPESLHESYGIIAEEFAEFFDEVRKKDSARDHDAVVKELTQLAGACQRAITELLLPHKLASVPHGTIPQSEI
jgi:predicted ATP-dependent Lon-type protease